MQARSQDMPYTIQMRGDSGYYSDVYESLGSEGMEWKISSDHNFDNHVAAINTATGETEPGLEPGDHGMLEFSVVPNSTDSITVDCVFDIKAYIESITLNGSGAIVKNVTEISDSALAGYAKAHIMLFAGYDDEANKYTDLIDNDDSLRRVLADQTYTKNGRTYTQIYWVWPLYLTELTSEDDSVIIYDAAERSDVITYIANNKDGFFKDCSDSASKVTTDLTTLSKTYDTTLYNHYSTRYDNADLDIGNNVSYILLSMKVE